MDKKKYYVSLQSREISQIQYQNNNAFTIYATPTEIQMLRKVLDNVHTSEFDTFWRAHVPILPYHNDPSNDRYDESLSNALSIIYELGDEQARKFIEESGILGDRPIDINR
ncbi:hydrolase [Pseudogracilibacillus sp. SE30717A]|uniref:hydrolase n=1 Tax=Pseudogracilibacillus sp. SE30717A TaxID=3098293 RepID=UPI00300DD81B